MSSHLPSFLGQSNSSVIFFSSSLFPYLISNLVSLASCPPPSQPYFSSLFRIFHFLFFTTHPLASTPLVLFTLSTTHNFLFFHSFPPSFLYLLVPFLYLLSFIFFLYILYSTVISPTISVTGLHLLTSREFVHS